MLINPDDVPAVFDEIADSGYGSIFLFEYLMANWNDTAVPDG